MPCGLPHPTSPAPLHPSHHPPPAGIEYCIISHRALHHHYIVSYRALHHHYIIITLSAIGHYINYKKHFIVIYKKHYIISHRALHHHYIVIYKKHYIIIYIECAYIIHPHPLLTVCICWTCWPKHSSCSHHPIPCKPRKRDNTTLAWWTSYVKASFTRTPHHQLSLLQALWSPPP